MSFKQGFLDRKEWVELARSMDYDFSKVQNLYTRIAKNVYHSGFKEKASYLLGHLSYWFVNEPAFIADFEVQQLEKDVKRWREEGKSLVLS